MANLKHTAIEESIDYACIVATLVCILPVGSLFLGAVREVYPVDAGVIRQAIRQKLSNAA